MDDLNPKLRLIESLQLQELKIYERFFITIEGQVHQLLPNINQPELLNEMIASKNIMMQDIKKVEIDLSPLRKEIGKLSQEGALEGINQVQLDKIKATDLSIIDLISKISLAEQSLTNKIKEQMGHIKGRLQHMQQTKGINSKYQVNRGRPSVFQKLNNNNGKPASTFETTG